MSYNQRLDVKEYIGARYIPMFFDDGTGSAEWRSTVEYEPLTIVLYQGNSYTSRQYVPVGIQITNTDYWLQTGNWNSQIEAYRQEVYTYSDRIDGAYDAASAAQTSADNAAAGVAANTQLINGLDDRIDGEDARIDTIEDSIDDLYSLPAARALAKRYFVFIGDSYQVGTTAGGTTQSFLDVLLGWGAIPSGHYWRSERGGAAFGNANNSFLSLIVALDNVISAADKNKVTDIVVTGGYNDASYISSLDTTINDFCNYCIEKYPNAQITLVPAGWRRFSGNATQPFEQLYQMVSAYRRFGGVKGARILLAAHNLFARCPYFISTDGIHPTTEGYNYLAHVVMQALAGADNCGPFERTVNIGNISAVSGVNSLASNAIPLYVMFRGNDTQYATASQIILDYSERLQVATNGGHIPLLGNATPYPYNFPYGGFPGSKINVIVQYYDAQTGGTAHFLETTASLGVDSNGNLVASIYCLKDSSGYGTIWVSRVYCDWFIFESIA